MIELSLEYLGKISGGSSVKEYDRTKICSFCGKPANRVKTCDIEGNGCTPMYYCEICWFIKNRNEMYNAVEIRRKEAQRRHKRKHI